jgi:RNA polymerase sigma-70 factor, ECF subfamily
MPTATVRNKAPALQEFERIFHEHYGLVYRTAYTITRKAEDAEDVAQTIFLSLLRRQLDSDAMNNLKGYLYKAAVNTSLGILRSRRRHVLLQERSELTATPATSSEELEAMDRRLWAAIAELQENASQALILRYIHGYSVMETARLLGRSRSSVAVMLFRSRVRLRKLIDDVEGEK